jgi:hypothetical protein
MGLMPTILHVYDDGIKEITPGDPGGPLIRIRKPGKKDDERTPA